MTGILNSFGLIPKLRLQSWCADPPVTTCHMAMIDPNPDILMVANMTLLNEMLENAAHPHHSSSMAS